MKQIVFHPDADAEIIDAAQYYEVNIPALFEKWFKWNRHSGSDPCPKREAKWL